MPSIRNLLMRQEVIIGLTIVALSIFIGLVNPSFFSTANVFRILRATIIVGMFAMGVLIVLISGGIDVSFPAIAVFAMYVTVSLIRSGTLPDNLILSYILAALIGLGLGLFNAIFIAWLRLPTLIVTLGTLSLFRGVLLFFVGSQRIRIAEVSPSLTELSRANLLTVENPGGGVANLHLAFAFLIVLAVIVWLLLRYTMLGRSIYAIGGDREAAERVGFNIRRTQFFIYAFVGLLAGITGLTFSALSREADPFSIVGIELDVIAAVVLGGASITGGRGTVIGTLLGVLLITLMSSSLVLLGISSDWQRFVVGLLIIIGTTIPVLQARLRRRVAA
ncbi:MAG: ABC transporter permease [Anaerolineae bacterium]|nr:ABC transporter permease [Anaerolineae bacterium]MDW8172374.1 ABC transporter permease [Anaerolineae bacterium]